PRCRPAGAGWSAGLRPRRFVPGTRSWSGIAAVPDARSRRTAAPAARPSSRRESPPRPCVCPSHEGYTHRMAQAPALPTGFELPLEPRLPRIGSVDQVAVEARATDLSRRSIKRETKLFALDLAVRMMDL